MNTHIGTPRDIESPYAWTRLLVSLLLMTIGGSGMYSVAVVLPRIQAEFAVARGDASLPYTLTPAISARCRWCSRMGRNDRFGSQLS